MNNDSFKESSLFGSHDEAQPADQRFLAAPGQRLQSSSEEPFSHPNPSYEDKFSDVQHLLSRLKVVPTRSSRPEQTAPPNIEPLSLEDAERAILSLVDSPEDANNHTLFVKPFLKEPVPPHSHSQISQSRERTASHSVPDIDNLTRSSLINDSLLGDESSIPTLESNSVAISSQFEDNLEAPSVEQGPFSSVASTDIFDSVDSVLCSVCDTKNIITSNYCAHCGSLLNFARRQQSGFTGVSKEPTALSRTANNELRAYLIAINDDGTEGKRIPVEYLETIIGRDTDSPFPTDSFLSPKHAKLLVQNKKLYIQDLESLNGTFIKLRQEKVIQSGDTFLMGRQVLSFEHISSKAPVQLRAPDGTRKMGSPATDNHYRLLQLGIGGILQNVYCLPKTGAQLGRERGDIIFPHDKFMSSRHAQIYPRNDGNFILADLNSSNGTWIKIWELTPLETQDYIFMGQQLFRVFIDQ